MHFSIVCALQLTQHNTFFAERIQRLQQLFPQQHICIGTDDKEFVLGRLKNKGFLAAKDDIILLTDPDFFTKTTFFEDIEKFIAASQGIPIFFTFPAYHATQKNSLDIWNAATPKDYDRELIKFFSRAVIDNVQTHCAFIAPYSNIILTTRKIFSYLGGYNENFTGYGSEDFEFMIRAMLALDISPQAKNILQDCYKPTTRDFFFQKKYQGFRRMLEAYSFLTESAGFRFVHLYHPPGNGSWYKKIDKNRVALRQELQPVLKNPCTLLDRDWLPHSRRIICILTAPDRWRLFLTLRCKDFQTIRFTGETDFQTILAWCETHKTKYIAFSDDITKNTHLLQLSEELKQRGCEVSILSDTVLKENGIFPLAIDPCSYTASRLGLGLVTPDIPYRYTKFCKRLRRFWRSLKNSIHDMRYRGKQ